MRAKKILIFPAGTEIAFEILNALKYSKFVEIYGGTSVADHSGFVYRHLITGFPFVDEPGFLEYLNKVISEYGIECIYPAHDSASVFFSRHTDDINAQVIISDAKTTEICRSKKETYRYLKDYSFIPKTFDTVESVERYPVFVKPAIGQGSKDARRIGSRAELEDALASDSSLIICEYLPGMEFTVDCFTDKDGNLLVSKMRDRQRIRIGINLRSKEYRLDEKAGIIAKTLNSKFSFKGAWFFQLKEDIQGEYRLLEISPRIPGTMGLSRNLGINFPMLTLFVFWGVDVSIIDNGYNIMLDRAFYSAYKIDFEYNHVYLDYDDTVTLNGKVNPDVMKFIYQAVNSGKKIHLLSKHVGDLYEDMRRLHIDTGIFEDITILQAEEQKSNYIKEQKSIFIDDSFAERKRIKDATGIPVFDVDMIESLIDWRM